MFRLMTTMVGILFLAAFLNACGSTQSDRAVSGAGIGAGVGAVGGALTGGSIGGGALLGAAGGAAVGALTQEDDVNLGKPAWKK